MGWTKRELIVQAFEEIGLAAYVFDLTPDQLQSGLHRLDAMMSVWNGKNILLGYPISADQDTSDLDSDSNVPPYANEAVYLNLAIRLAPGFGKTISPDVKISAKLAYDGLLSRATMPEEMQMPATMPRGAGQKSNAQPFVNVPDNDPISIDVENGQLIFRE